MRALKRRWPVGVACILASILFLPSLTSGAVANSSTPSASELFGDQVSMLGRIRYPGVYAGAALVSDGSLVIYATIGASALVSAVAALDTSASSYSFVSVPEGLSTMLATTMALNNDQAGLAADGIHLNTWGPDPTHGQVQIQLQTPSSTDFAAMDARLATSVGPTTSTNYLARATQLLQGKYGSGLAVDSVFGQKHTLFDKSDPQPYTGGASSAAVLGTNSYSVCSSSFPLAYGPYPSYWVMTAGHCSKVGQSWEEEQAGFYTPNMGVTAGTAVNNGSDDWAWIQGYTTFRDQVLGGPVNSPVPYNISGSELPPINSPIAWDGARTGEVRWIPLTNADQCANFPLHAPYSGSETVCNLIVSPNSNPGVAKGGDSGGPVFQHTCSTCNAVYPIATIVGGDNPNGYGGNAYAEWVGQELSEVPGLYIPTSA